MGIWAGIIAIFQFLGKALDLSTYWLNPKERKRRRKKGMMEKLRVLEGDRDVLFKKGATDGFTRKIDIQIAAVEKKIIELKQDIKALG